MFQKHLFLFLIFISSISFSQEQEIRVVKNQLYKDSLQPQSLHRYHIETDSAQFLFGRVNQLSVDVKVRIKDPKGKLLAEIDGPAAGPEIFSIYTSEKGNYVIEVIPFEEANGHYTFQLTKMEPIAATKEGKIDQLMMQYDNQDTPGAEVLVMKDGEILFKKAYGMANLSYNIPFKTNSVTNIGSTSKQFTAFAINLLAQQGKLSLDDNINKYFPEFPEFTHPVSIRNLLSHTSGYRELLNTLSMTGRDLTSSLDRKMMLRLIENQPELQDEPGTAFNYNNTGYTILAALVNRITGQPFPEWMKEHVFNPLGMDHTVVRAHSQQVIENRTAGYTIGDKGDYIESQDMDGSMGAGGIYTTLDDLAQWIRNFHTHELGGEAIYKEMTTPFILKNGEALTYGQGLHIGSFRGQKIIEHGGADKAHRSMLMYFPDMDAAVITQSNNSGFKSEMAYKVAAIYFEDSFEAAEVPPTPIKNSEDKFVYDPAKFEALMGSYAMVEAPDFVLSFFREGDQLLTQATGQQKLELEPVSDSTFQVEKVNARLTFHLKEDGTAESLTLHQNGDHLARKVQEETKPVDLNQFTGRYFSEEIETVYTVKLKEGELFLFNYQLGKDVKLSAANQDIFKAGFPFSKIEFQRDDAGNITGFFGSNGRTRNVFFEKMKN